MTTQIPSTLRRCWASRLVALVCGESGTSAVEFALAAPVVIGLLVPVADLGMAFSQQIKVQQSAAAGAQYALFHAWNSSSAATIANVVTGASTLTSVTASPAPSQFCGCPTTRNRPIPHNSRIRCWAR
jgi:Flp pilus assembly protein TadG